MKKNNVNKFKSLFVTLGIFTLSCSLNNNINSSFINNENKNFNTKAASYKIDLKNYNQNTKKELDEEKKIKDEKIKQKLEKKKKFKFRTKACSNPITPIKAGLIPIDDQITLTLSNQPQTFKFYVQAGQRIKISQSELDANDSYLKLFSPSNLNTPFAFNDDTFGLDSYIDTVATESGFWVIQSSTYEEVENCQAPTGNFKLNINIDNIYLPSSQKVSHVVSAMDKNGNYVLVWQVFRNGTWDIIGGSFDKNGNPLGPRFAVNNDGNNLPGDQINPSIAMNRETGDFIVIWQGFGNFYYPSPETCGIFFKRFHVDGSPISIVEPLINIGVNGYQINPDVTIDDSGNTVVVWETTGSTNNTDGIYMRKIDPYGNFLGSEVKINQYSTNATHPKVAIVPKVGETNRQVLVVWQGNNISVDTTGIFQRKISYDFGWMDNEVIVNSSTNGLQSNPDLAFDYDGRAVVTWQTTGSSDNTDGIKAIVYNIDSSIFRNEFRVNNTVTDVSFPVVAINQSNGVYKYNYRIAWEGTDPNFIYSSATQLFQKWYDVRNTFDLNIEARYYIPSNGNNSKPSIAMNADSTNDANLIFNPFDTNISRFNLSYTLKLSNYMQDGIYNLPVSSNDYGIYPYSFIY